MIEAFTITMASDKRVKRRQIWSERMPTNGNERTLPINCAALTTLKTDTAELPK